MGPPGLPQLPQLILNDNFEDPLSASQTGGVYEVGQYRVGEMLGAGTFGVVRKAVHLPTGKEVAAKILFLPTIGRERRLQLILEEVAVLKINRHPNIIRLLDAFEGEDQKYYLVFELCTGGELYDRIVEAQRFTERTAGVLLATIIAAVAFLHEPPHQIIHRDLKLENILFKSEAPNSPLVIVDFGVALMLEDADETSSEIVGSRPNMAPELIQGKEYGAEVDVYALGVIAYTLLSGCHPFQEEMEDPDPRVLNAAIINGRFSFEDKDWSHVSEEAKEFVASLMSLNPADRPTAAQALASPWLRRCCPPGYLEFLELVNSEMLARQFIALGQKPPEHLLSLQDVKRRRDSLPIWNLTAKRRRTTLRPHGHVARVRTSPIGEPNTPIALTFAAGIPAEPAAGSPAKLEPAVLPGAEALTLSPSAESVLQFPSPVGSPVEEASALPPAAPSAPAARETEAAVAPAHDDEEEELVSGAFKEVPILQIADLEVTVSPPLSPLLEQSLSSTTITSGSLSPTLSFASFALDSPPMVSVAPSRPLSRDASQSKNLSPVDLLRTWPAKHNRQGSDDAFKKGLTLGAPGSPPVQIDPAILEIGSVVSPPPDAVMEDADESPEDRARFEQWMASMRRVRDATLRRKTAGAGSSPSSPMMRRPELWGRSATSSSQGSTVPDS